jgi:hypothetical protein
MSAKPHLEGQDPVPDACPPYLSPRACPGVQGPHTPGSWLLDPGIKPDDSL